MNTAPVNVDFVAAEGIDFALNYNNDLNGLSEGGIGFLGMSDLGSMTLNVNDTYLIDRSDEFFGVPDDHAGELGAFEHKIQGRFIYNNGPFTFQWQTAYNDGGPIDNVGFFSGSTLDEHIKCDMQLRYDLWKGKAQVFFGVDNVVDAPAGRVLTSVGGTTAAKATGTGTAPKIYDPTGHSYS